MSNVVDLLLGLDSNKVQLPTMDVEVKRLSSIAGKPVIFTLKGLSQDTITNAREVAMKTVDGNLEIDQNEMQLQLLLQGTVTPSFKSQDLMSHYGVHTSYDLIKKLLSAGEMAKLTEIIIELSGINDDDVVEKVKKKR